MNGKIRVIAFVGGFAVFVLAAAGVIFQYALGGLVSTLHVASPATQPAAVDSPVDETGADDSSSMAKKPPANRGPAPRRRGTARAPNPPNMQPPPIIEHPAVAAAAIVDLILDLQVNAAQYVGRKHNVLQKDLATLQQAANDVIHDDGKDAGLTDQRSVALSAAIQLTIARARMIGSRPAETQDAKDRSADLVAKLTEISAK